MGNSARDNNAYGGGQAAARPPSVKQPNAMTKAPGAMTEALKGAVGQAWSPAQTTAGGRWEVPAGAPAGAIGRNWVPYTPPAPAAPAAAAPSRLPSGRDALAHMIALSASNNGRYMPQRNPQDMWGGGGAWMNGGR